MSTDASLYCKGLVYKFTRVDKNSKQYKNYVLIVIGIITVRFAF